MSSKAIPVVRGCGTRIKGGLYVESGLSPHGQPIESFLVCPPALINIQEIGITPVGTKLIERDGVFHVLDWIGSQHYPNPADFIEEVRRFGLSRRIAKTVDLSKLSAGSRILVLHSRAYLSNFDEYCSDWKYREATTRDRPSPRCPKHIVQHDQPEPPAMCVGVYWQDVEGGQPVDGAAEARLITRKMPSFSYTAYARPQPVRPEYQPAIFASLPITRLVAIHSNSEEDARNRSLLGRSSLPSGLEEA